MFDWLQRLVPFLLVFLFVLYLVGLVSLNFVLKRIAGVSIGAISFRSLRNITIVVKSISTDPLVHINAVKLKLQWPLYSNGWKWLILSVESTTASVPFPFPTSPTPQPTLRSRKVAVQDLPHVSEKRKRPLGRRALETWTSLVYGVVAKVVSGFEVRLENTTAILGDDIVATSIELVRLGVNLFSPGSSAVSRLPFSVDVAIREWTAFNEVAAKHHLLRVPEVDFSVNGGLHLDLSSVDRVQADLKIGNINLDAGLILQVVEALQYAQRRHEYAKEAALYNVVEPEEEEAEEVDDVFAEDGHESDSSLGGFFNAPLTDTESTSPPTSPMPQFIQHATTLDRATTVDRFFLAPSTTLTMAELTEPVQQTISNVIRRARIRIRRIQCDLNLVDKNQDSTWEDVENGNPAPALSMSVNEFVVAGKASGSMQKKFALEGRIGRADVCITGLAGFRKEATLAWLDKLTLSGKASLNAENALNVNLQAVVEKPKLGVKMEEWLVLQTIRLPDGLLQSNNSDGVYSPKPQNIQIVVNSPVQEARHSLSWLSKVELTAKVNNPEAFITSGNEAQRLEAWASISEVKFTTLISYDQDKNAIESTSRFSLAKMAVTLQSHSTFFNPFGIGEAEVKLDATVPVDNMQEHTVDVLPMVNDIFVRLNDQSVAAMAEMLGRIPMPASTPSKAPRPPSADEGVPIGLLLPRVNFGASVNNLYVQIYGPADEDDTVPRGINFGIQHIYLKRPSALDTTAQPEPIVLTVENILLQAFSLYAKDNAGDRILQIPKILVSSPFNDNNALNLSCDIDLIDVKFGTYAVYAICAGVKQVLNLVKELETNASAPTPSKDDRMMALAVQVNAHAVEVHLKLSGNVHAWLSVTTCTANLSNDRISAHVTRLVLCGQSPLDKKQRVEVISVDQLKGLKYLLFDTPMTLEINTLKLCQPDLYNLSDIFDHLNNTGKAIKWISGRVLEGKAPAYSVAHILLPPLSVHVLAFLFELDDSPFEVALARNYRLGRLEQRERIARWDALEHKLQGMRAKDAAKASASSSRKGSTMSTTESAIHSAHSAMRAYDTQSWLKKLRKARAEFEKKPQALLSVEGKNLHISLAPPDFGLEGAPLFITNIDKTTPLDFVYDLLIPIHVKVSAGQLSLSLRDYPTKLVHFGGMVDAKELVPSLVIEGDIVVQEQFPQHFAFREIPVLVVDAITAPVMRTISPVKIYSDVVAKVASTAPTEITFGNAMLPALQEMGYALGRFAAPNPDPSPQLGFWDKLPLMLHGRARLGWADGGELRFKIRGGLDPYDAATESNALELICKGVDLRIGGEHDDVLALNTRELLVGFPGDKDSGIDLEKTLFHSTGGIEIKFGMQYGRDDGAEFQPHHLVTTHVEKYCAKDHDSFKHYRSHHLHLRVGISLAGGRNGYQSKNSVHLTSRLITRLERIFGYMSPPPVRTGTMYPAQEVPPPNFARYIRTARVQFALANFQLAMVHRQPSIGLEVGPTSLVGAKAMIQSITADVVAYQKKKQHRKEGDLAEGVYQETEFIIEDALLDITELDVRILGTKEGLNLNPQSDVPDIEVDAASVKSQASLAEWIADEDFVELDMPDIQSDMDNIRLEPFIWAPRAVYFTQSPIKSGFYKTTYAKGKDSRSVQVDLLTLRKVELKEEMDATTKRLKDLKRALGDSQFAAELSQEEKVLEAHIKSLEERYNLVTECIDLTWSRNLNELLSEAAAAEQTFEGASMKAGEDQSHRVVVHNPCIIWSIPVRNGVFRLATFVEQYHALSYYMSTSAVKILRNLSFESHEEEQTKPMDTPMSPTEGDMDTNTVDEMIRMLEGGNNDTSSITYEWNAKTHSQDNYTLAVNVVVQLLHPQVRFQLALDAPSIVYLASESIQVQSLSILDPEYEGDISNEVVKTRFILKIDNLQLLMAFKSHFDASPFGYTNLDYGCVGGGYWPAWLPLEMLAGVDADMGLFQQLVDKTSAVVSFDRNNPLRLVKNNRKEFTGLDLEALEADARADRIFVHLPVLRMRVDSDQFAELFTIATDLMVYREPVKKERLEQIQSVMISASTGEFGNVADVVMNLQEKIRTLKDVMDQYESKLTTLTDQQQVDYNAVAQQVADIKSYLYIVMEGITRSQQSFGKSKDVQKSVRAVILAETISLADNAEPLCEATMNGTKISLFMNEDDSSVNTFEVDQLYIDNLRPNAYYKEMLYPFVVDQHQNTDFSRRKMIRVYWRQLAPVAGINVIEHFEINVFPLMVQLSYDIGKQIFIYLFPEKRKQKALKEEDKETKLQPSNPQRTRKVSTPDALSVGDWSSSRATAVDSEGSSADTRSIAVSAMAMTPRAKQNVIKVNTYIDKMKTRATEVPP